MTYIPNLATYTSIKSGVEWTRPEVTYYLDQYTLIDDCLAGEKQIKSKETEYLPRPNPVDDTDGSRYRGYILRAVFYNVAARTLEGLVGRVFIRDPKIEVPTVLQPVVDDANGKGSTLDQVAQTSCAIVLAKGRAGLHIDFPNRAEPTSQAELLSGAIRPTIHLYEPTDVINWRTIRVNGKEIYTLVVARETYFTEDDGFAIKTRIQFRVLRLVGGAYTIEFWRQKADTNGFELSSGPFMPLDANGKPFDEIPFRFIGPRDNTSEPEKPPLYDLCSLNIAHYRNSADYEESAFVTGQPTIWASGLTEAWVKNVLDGKLKIGARGIIALPVNGAAGIIQIEPNTLPKEAMDHKERQMVSLGAKLIEQRDVQRTATEANIENSAETSTLASTARNVSQAIKWALQWCAFFVSQNENKIEFALNTDFGLTALTPEERAQLLKEWVAEAISFSELRANLQRAGIVVNTPEEAMKEIEKDRVNFAPEVDPNDPNNGGDNNQNSGE